MSTEAIRLYGFDTSLREIPGPRRTFESPESDLPLPGISYAQRLYPEREMVRFTQEYIDTQKKAAKVGMAVGGVVMGTSAATQIPGTLASGAIIATVGFLNYRFFVEHERLNQQTQPDNTPQIA